MSTVDPTRARLIRSAFDWSPLRVVAEAIAAATEHEKRIYVERIGDRYRWSLTHTGGPYPLLRIAARYLKADYTKLLVGSRALPEGTSVLFDDRADQTPPDKWVVLEFDGVANAQAVAEKVRVALASPGGDGQVVTVLRPG